MSYPCELDLSNIPLSELNFNTRIYILLKDKNISTIEDLQRVINKGVLLDIYGIGVTIAKNIVYTLGEFYFKNCELL